MSPLSAHHEIIRSLAEEVRMTVDWLNDQSRPPAADEVRKRIRTLREAAKMAGMNAVEAALDKTDRELDEHDPRESPSLTAKALDHLSEMIIYLARASEEKEFEWLGAIRRCEEELDRTGEKLSQSIEVCRRQAILLDSCSSATTSGERVRLLDRLGDELEQGTSLQRDCLEQLHLATASLAETRRKLVRELSSLQTDSVAPLLATLQERARQFSRSRKRPVSVLTRCTGLRLASRQLEPLKRIMDNLLQSILTDGFESPGERRKAGKATVGTVKISCQMSSDLAVIEIEDDGLEERPPPEAHGETAEDLKLLRARLFVDEAFDAGQRLLLKFPVLCGGLETVCVKTAAGRALVPLGVIGELFTAESPPDGSLDIVDFARRASDQYITANGLVFELQDWKGVLFADILSTRLPVVAEPPEAGDEDWIIGRVCEDGDSLPIIHPLPFMKHEEDSRCIYPATA